MQPAPTDLAQKLGPLHIGLRKDVVVTRQAAGVAVKYVAHDPISFQNHAFTVLEYG